MIENLNIFDFSLSVEDRQILSGLDTNKSSFFGQIIRGNLPVIAS